MLIIYAKLNSWLNSIVDYHFRLFIFVVTTLDWASFKRFLFYIFLSLWVENGLRYIPYWYMYTYVTWVYTHSKYATIIIIHEGDLFHRSQHRESFNTYSRSRPFSIAIAFFSFATALRGVNHAPCWQKSRLDPWSGQCVVTRSQSTRFGLTLTNG